LRRLAGRYGQLPDSIIITERIEVEDNILVSGGFADLRCGRCVGHLVAVKTLRVAEKDDLLKIRKVSVNAIFAATWDPVSITLLQQFCKEVILWNTLAHPNVLRLVGVLGGVEKGQFVAVSEWMKHGNITEYIRNNAVNRLELVRDFASSSLPSLKCNNSCTGQPRV
jgi:serine/threonine protein kinase